MTGSAACCLNKSERLANNACQEYVSTFGRRFIMPADRALAICTGISKKD